MSWQKRTDLAIESREIYREGTRREVPGVQVEEAGYSEIKVTRVKVLDELGERYIGKPRGNYITLEVPKLNENDMELQQQVSTVMSEELKKLINIDKKAPVLVVGLGNWNITPDALGPKVVSKLMITRHLLEYIPDQVDERVRPVCAVSPGVLGITGIETGEIIRGVVEKVKPALLIAIDALASRKMERISTTIQIGDTGINPGSGIGNRRMTINKENLGIPVIAIGVPTVVDAATIASDVIDLVIDSLIKNTPEDSPIYNIIKNMDRGDKYALIREVLNPYTGNLVVTPKEIDSMIENISKIVANGINLALHPGITYEEMLSFIS